MDERKFFRYGIEPVINVTALYTVHYQELCAGYASPDESHDFWELVYADRNGVTLEEDRTARKISQGCAAFIKPNAVHSVICSEDANIFIISFECLSEGMGAFDRRTVKIPAGKRALLQTLMTEATNTFKLPDFDPTLNRLERLPAPDLGGEQVIKNTLELLLIDLLRTDGDGAAKQFYSTYDTPADLRDAILNSLSKHVYGVFSLDMLCDELHYGKTRLCTFFRKSVGKTIYRAYLEMKVDESKRLIRKGLSFSEISELLGFSSPSHFIGVFKKHVGRTPGEYLDGIKR